MLLDYSCERNITQAAASLLRLKLNPREEFQGRRVGSASQEGFGISLRAILQSNFFFSLALDPCCSVQAFSSCSEWGLLSTALRGLLVAVASPAAEHWAPGVWASVAAAHGLSSCGVWALGLTGFSRCNAQS